jgi:hypothetical protein
MRGQLTRWLFGMGFILLCMAGWGFHEANRARPVVRHRANHHSCKKVQGHPRHADVMPLIPPVVV